jgi:peptidoglycan/xylan/chitin deacetylase (PgdA/CDA1 family)
MKIFRSLSALPSAPASANLPAPRIRKVWLTFDDGPSRLYTPQVLDSLDRHGLKATFFVVGSMVIRGGAVMERLVADGHRIGNHTFSHRNLTKLADEEIANEILRTQHAIARHTVPEKIFRPPFGFHNSRVDRVVSSLGYRMILWDVNPFNWGPPVPRCIWVPLGIFLVRRHNPSCVLLHDIHSATALHLDRFIRRLTAIKHVSLEAPSTL